MEGYISEIRIFAGNFAPLYWNYCDGSLQSIANNTALFSLIGTTYGGDGQTTFALPDLRGRVPVHPGQGPGLPSYELGQMAGATSTTILSSNMPAHTHPAQASINCSNAPGDNADPTSEYPSFISNTEIYSESANGLMNASMVTVGMGPLGGSQPISLMQPYLAMNYIICTEGIFPSRS